MPDTYVTLISSLVSGAIGVTGALGGVYLNNRHQSVQRRRDLLRQRGEELYGVVVEWLDGFFGHYMRRNLVMQGKITYNECIDQDVEWGKNKTTPPVTLRLEMLIDVYFPSARPAYEEILRRRSELNAIELTFKRRYEVGQTDGSAFLEPYVDAQERLEEAREVLLKRVLEEMREIG
jgi:hypothetical protein